MKRWIGVAFVCLSTSAFAEDKKIDWKPIAALAAGQTFDVASTRVAISRGCVEGNPVYRTETPSVGTLMAGKAISVGAVATAIVFLQRSGHPKVARWIGYSGGAAGVGVGVWNLSVTCGGMR